MSSASTDSRPFNTRTHTYEQAEAKLWRKLVVHAEGRSVERTAQLLLEAWRVVGQKICPKCHRKHKDYRRIIFEVWPVAKESDLVQHKHAGYTMLTCRYALPDYFDQLTRFIDMVDRGSRDSYDVAIILLYNGREAQPEAFYIRVPEWIKYEEAHRGTETTVVKPKRKTMFQGTASRKADQHPLPLHTTNTTPPQSPERAYEGGGGKRRLSLLF